MSFWAGLVEGIKDADILKEKDQARKDRQERLAIEDARYASEVEYRTGRDKIADTYKEDQVRRQKDKDMATAGFVFDEEKGGYVHQSQLTAGNYSAGGAKMTPSETREAAAAKLNIDREVKDYYTAPTKDATMAPGSRVMTETDKAFFETLGSDPRTQTEVNTWFVANKDKYGLTVDMLPTLYTLDVSTPAGQEALTAVIGVDDVTGFSKAVSLAQSAVPPGTFATLDESAMPMSLTEEDKQYSYSKEKLAGDLAREQIKRADAGLSTTRITQILRDLDNSGTESAAFQSGVMELGGADYLLALEDSGDQRWENISNNSWFTPLLGGQPAATKDVDKETVSPGDIVTGTDGSSYLVSTGDDGQVRFEKTDGSNLLPPSQTTPVGEAERVETTKPVVDRRLPVGEAERVSAIEDTLTADQEGEVVKTESGTSYRVTVTGGGSARLVPTEAEEVTPAVQEMETLLSPSDIGTEVTVDGKVYTVTKSPDTGLPILTEEPDYEENLLKEYADALEPGAIDAEGQKLVTELLNPNLTDEDGKRLVEEFTERYGKKAADKALRSLLEKIASEGLPQGTNKGRDLDADNLIGHNPGQTPLDDRVKSERTSESFEKSEGLPQGTREGRDLDADNLIGHNPGQTPLDDRVQSERTSESFEKSEGLVKGTSEGRDLDADNLTGHSPGQTPLDDRIKSERISEGYEKSKGLEEGVKRMKEMILDEDTTEESLEAYFKELQDKYGEEAAVSAFERATDLAMRTSR